MKHEFKLKPFILIIIHICIATALISISKYTFKQIDVNPFLFLFYRNAASFIILLPLIVPAFLISFKKHRYHISFMRSGSGVVAIAIWTYAYSHLALSTATMLTFITPILTLLLASRFLKERLSKTRIAVILISFIGVFIAIKPQFQGEWFYYLLVFISCIFWSIGNISRKVASNISNIKNWICYSSIWSVILTFLLALPFIKFPDFNLLPFILIAGILTAFANIMSFNAYKASDVGLIQSFDFLRLIFASLVDVFIFNHKLTVGLFIGSFIIISSCIFIIYSENRKMQKLNKTFLP